MPGVLNPPTRDLQTMDAPLIARLLSTLPTHDYTGAPLARQWAGLAWAQGLDTALARAFLVSRDKGKSLIALVHSIMYLDYTLWTGRSAHTAVVRDSGKLTLRRALAEAVGNPAVNPQRPIAYWATHTEHGGAIPFGVAREEHIAGRAHGNMEEYLLSRLSGESARGFAERQRRRAEILRSGTLVRLAPLTSPLAYGEVVHDGTHTLEPLLDLHGRYITSEQRTDPHRVFDPHHPDADHAGFRARSLLKPELGRRTAAIYGVNRERWARLRAF
ncbi:hypothetical protein NBRC10512_007469 [Rhodotorula toruloides]|uniref:RHTO0S33e00386g1_1 n=2 Tax=Rhodotorula toruloides TaxID=5286 RepID=A0A061BP50_RHOTO|nr:uncharacterized protein RHTO_06673 [Rhodotorula toruloides NP11]EMS18128.1 hypothetical protein RHTO_06673 [Rhodotorula toruloides NP11]CDR49794.1 RHTO0S33e00386g1_1 [Rhodotorula toruloides]